jgi:signal transduction histidine kinase
MGLGMHLVYNLVTQRIWGSIVCESGAPGEGAHFHIEVPR